MVEFKIQGTEDYPNILKYLVDRGIDAITELEMEQIEVICMDYYHFKVDENQRKTIFSEAETELERIEETEKKIQKLIEKRKYDRICAILKLRSWNMDTIMLEVIALYKILKISYKRKGRIEVIEPTHQNIQKQKEEEIPPGESRGR